MDDPSSTPPEGPHDPSIPPTGSGAEDPGAENGERGSGNPDKTEGKQTTEPGQETESEIEDKEKLPDHAPGPVRAPHPSPEFGGGAVEKQAHFERQNLLDQALQRSPSEKDIDEQRIKALQEKIKDRKESEFSGEPFVEHGDGVLSEHHKETMDKGGVGR